MTQPTIGSNVWVSDLSHRRSSGHVGHVLTCQVEEVKHENITFQVWDLGGQARRAFCLFFQHGFGLQTGMSQNGRAQLWVK